MKASKADQAKSAVGTRHVGKEQKVLVVAAKFKIAS